MNLHSISGTLVVATCVISKMKPEVRAILDRVRSSMDDMIQKREDEELQAQLEALDSGVPLMWLVYIGDGDPGRESCNVFYSCVAIAFTKEEALELARASGLDSKHLDAHIITPLKEVS